LFLFELLKVKTSCIQLLRISSGVHKGYPSIQDKI